MKTERLLLVCVSLAILSLMLTSSSDAAIDMATVAGYWTFDEGSGDKVGDSSGNGNDGTNMGAKWANGRSGKALEFQLGTLVEVPHSPSLDITDEITITAWISTEHTGLQTFVGKDDDAGANRSWHFCTTSEGGEGVGRFNVWTPEHQQMNGSVSVSTDEWTFIAATYDGSKMRLYPNGVLDTEADKTGDLAPATGEGLDMGCMDPEKGGGWWWHGGLDEIVIFDEALSEAELGAVMNAGPAAVSAADKLATTWGTMKTR